MASDKRIEFLARAIVNRLEDRGLVEFGDAEAGIQTVIETLEKYLAQSSSPAAEGNEPGSRN